MKEQLTDFCIFLENEGVIEKPVEIDVIEKFVKNNQGNDLKKIALIVAEKYRIQVEMLNIKTRSREIVEPRQLAMYMMAKFTKKSYAVIGAFFTGGSYPFNHSTISYAVNSVNNLKDTNKEYRKIFNEIKDKIEESLKK